MLYPVVSELVPEVLKVRAGLTNPKRLLPLDHSTMKPILLVIVCWYQKMAPTFIPASSFARTITTVDKKIYLSTRFSLPVCTSHKTTDALPEPLPSRLASAEKAREVTARSCPLRVRRALPVAVSQIITVRSSPPVAIKFPSAEKAMAFTAAECFLSCRRKAPVCRSQRLTLPFPPALARVRPA